jgi:dienelactone hydrolase
MVHAERELADGLQGYWLEPEENCSTGVVLLGGSSGNVPIERARLIAALGCRVAALRWFGGAEQSPGICEIPLELFQTALDRLSEAGCRRLAVIGTPKGAEAALLVGSFDSRVTLSMAFSPSSVVWANVGPGQDGFEWPQRSSFTKQGVPFAFSPHAAEDILSVRRVPSIRYLELFEKSISKFAPAFEAAAIPVEQAEGDVILVAGGDDHLWPSAFFARALAERRRSAEKDVTLLIHPDAGHRTLLPGETAVASKFNDLGGNDAADAALGTQAWKALSGWIAERHCDVS